MVVIADFCLIPIGIGVSLIRGRLASNVQNHPDIRKLKVLNHRGSQTVMAAKVEM